MEATYEEIINQRENEDIVLDQIRIGKTAFKFVKPMCADLVEFKKRCTQGREWLEITTIHKKELTKQCDMMHDHPYKTETFYSFSHLDWEHVEKLIEWLNQGAWSKRRTVK